jgi:transposase
LPQGEEQDKLKGGEEKKASRREKMPQQKEPLRTLSQQEERELQRVVKASSERVDVVKRAKALLAVKAGKAYTQAAREAGYQSGDSVSQLVGRFNERGLAALPIAAGRGRKATYTKQQRARILQEVQREPERKADQTATWSLSRLQRALRRSDLPRIARETIRQELHEQGYSYQDSRTWCRTGSALRKRKSGTVRTYDEQTPEKKD